MRIGLNILYLIPGKVGGTETYARELISALNKQLNPGDELIIYASRETAPTFVEAKQVKIVALPIYAINRPLRLLAEQILLPIYLIRDKIDVIFSLGYSAPFLHHCPSVVTIHDLNWYFHPEDFNYLNRIFWSVFTRLSAFTSNHVITDSASSAKDIKKVLKLNNVTAILHATPSKASPTKPKFSMPAKYILTVSASYPHKNLLTLITVFNSLTVYDKSLHLVICGLSGKASNEIKEAINKSKASGRIILLGYISNDELGYVYSHAKVFIFPSAYEGFGYPVLEAMSYKVPVVSSNATSLSEVVGSGGVLVSPYEVKNYSQAIKKILNNKKYRDDLIIRGTARSSELKWDSTAKATLNILKKEVNHD